MFFFSFLPVENASGFHCESYKRKFLFESVQVISSWKLPITTKKSWDSVCLCIFTHPHTIRHDLKYTFSSCNLIKLNLRSRADCMPINAFQGTGRGILQNADWLCVKWLGLGNWVNQVQFKVIIILWKLSWNLIH